MPACSRRRGRYVSGSLGGDEFLVTHRLMSNSELEHSIEHHPAAAGTPTVETEYELVQVVGQVRTVHCALVGTQQPPFGQRCDPMHTPGRSSPGSSPQARAARWLRGR